MVAPASDALFSRRAGVLAHVSSLPGSGSFDGAEPFLDWCVAAGLRLWQVLPLGPPGPGHSPYACTSVFAGNPAWLGESCGAPDEPFDAFVASPDRAWLDDWTLYAALKEHHHGAPWMTWDSELRRRDPVALRRAARELEESRRRHARVQWKLDAAARAVRDAAEQRGIVWLGDLPFCVALDSADVWSRRELFRVDEDGHPAAIAGCPPDYFTEEGQRWNQPLLDWDAHASEGFRWWIERCRAALAWVHVVRLDHFRGYRAFWEIPATAATAAGGRWVEGPGESLFEQLRLEGLVERLVAEDLGEIDDSVHRLRERYGLPRMHVLQFGLADATSVHHPDRHEAHATAYTGTHDNDTFAGWYGTLDDEARARVDAVLRRHAEANGDNELKNPARAAIECAWASPAAWAVAPLQDMLGLGGEARMNLPGEPDGQWAWRCADGALAPTLAGELLEVARRHGRS